LSLSRRLLCRFLGLIELNRSNVDYYRRTDHEGRLLAIARVCSHLEAKYKVCKVFNFKLMREAQLKKKNYEIIVLFVHELLVSGSLRNSFLHVSACCISYRLSCTDY
jgi:hypothetical protein